MASTYVRWETQWSEIELGIGCEVGTLEGCTREWLYWYNEHGDRFPTPANVIEQERQRADRAFQQLGQERRLREELLNRLRERGINLDDF